MFTFRNLGKQGRFGNQLFQIASTVGVAINNDQEYVFPEWKYSALFQTPIPQTNRPLVPDLTITQGPARFHFMDFKLAAVSSDLIDLNGFFQSEKYFVNCEETVRSYFEPSTSILREIEEDHGERLLEGPTCIIVVRRGDYALYPLQFPMMPAQFYRRAIETFDSDTMFLVTSDDIEWCQANITAKRIKYLPQVKWAHNFFIGTSCQDVITSNTTFGWWIAWLNKNQNKRVIAPKQWFGPSLGHLDIRDLLPENWVTLDAF
jgi:hypothetical protein